MPNRPRSVWWAFGVGLLSCLAIFGGVLLPVLSLVATSAGFLGLVEVPTARITVGVIGGYALAAGFIAMTLVSRNGALAWIASVAAVIAAVIASVYPAVAIALSVVDGIGEVVPFITEWIGGIRGLAG